jgi:hypothetical protein
MSLLRRCTDDLLRRFDESIINQNHIHYKAERVSVSSGDSEGGEEQGFVHTITSSSPRPYPYLFDYLFVGGITAEDIRRLYKE